MSYKRLMRHEHLSNSEEIIACARHVFGDVRVERFPDAAAARQSLYTYVEAEKHLYRGGKLPACHSKVLQSVLSFDSGGLKPTLRKLARGAAIRH